MQRAAKEPMKLERSTRDNTQFAQLITQIQRLRERVTEKLHMPWLIHRVANEKRKAKLLVLRGLSVFFVLRLCNAGQTGRTGRAQLV